MIFTEHNEQHKIKLMKKMIYIFMFACMLTTGCGSIARFADNYDYIFYESTRTDIEMIGNCLQSSPSGSWYVGPPGWILIPFIIADLPLSVTVDTVSIPYDIYRFHKYKIETAATIHARKFWAEAFQTDSITYEDAERYLNVSTHDQVYLALTRGEGGSNVINAVFNVSMAREDEELLKALSSHHGISPDQCRRLCQWADAGGPDYIKCWLARNSATPVDILKMFVISPDQLLCWSVGEAGTLPIETITQALDETPPEWYQGLLKMASNPSTPQNSLIGLSRKQYRGSTILVAVAGNTNSPVEALQYLSKSPVDSVREAVTANPSTPPDVIKAMQKRDMN